MVAYSPYTSVADDTFLPNLLLMHTIIIIPLVVPPSSTPLLPNIRPHVFAVFLAAVSLILHAYITVSAFASLAPGTDLISELTNWCSFAASAWKILQTHHPAQSSIGWDVVWTTASFVIWTLLGSSHEEDEEEMRKSVAIRRALAAPLLSVGVVAPWVFDQGGEEIQAAKQE